MQVQICPILVEPRVRPTFALQAVAGGEVAKAWAGLSGAWLTARGPGGLQGCTQQPQGHRLTCFYAAQTKNSFAFSNCSENQKKNCLLRHVTPKPQGLGRSPSHAGHPPGWPTAQQTKLECVLCGSSQSSVLALVPNILSMPKEKLSCGGHAYFFFCVHFCPIL